MWRRSTRSGTSGNCVEVRRDLAAIRDSKSDQATLSASRQAVVGLVRFVRSR
ncbi:MAG TPA: DUF397 domain-containing protein [Actinophytocola sp.]|uniref:DUF397 domain-containing protein n=1 Tax=Actinophytocola sp. TaxID=1872138 RepID=UPI002DB980FB|nr:DUF397 domain-containing protein [Actinophytocola sp.]HEU5474770.1 DUF397 domain-containing protein [Actinophytocola sp.]